MTLHAVAAGHLGLVFELVDFRVIYQPGVTLRFAFLWTLLFAAGQPFHIQTIVYEGVIHRFLFLYDPDFHLEFPDGCCRKTDAAKVSQSD